jgi:tRNA pseudouridine38-40 synthase
VGKDKLDFEAMKKASKLFIGMNDFSSFSDDDPEEKSTKVAIDDIELSEKEDLILIRITGSHFIWKMVRRIVGILVEVGRGKMSDKDILFYLNNKSNEPAKFTAPPSGLFLEKVIY